MVDRFTPYFERYGQPLLDAFGVMPELVNTGGGCMALEMALEGVTVWVTDDGDPLSPWDWRERAVGGDMSDDVFGFMVSLHRTDQPDDIGGACDPMYGDPTPQPDRLVALVRVAIDAARAGEFIDYGDYTTASDKPRATDDHPAVAPITDAHPFANHYRETYPATLHPSMVARVRDGVSFNLETGN